MNKFFSMLKATMSQDMELFKYKAKANSSSITKLSIPIVLSLLVMFSIGSMYYPIATELQKSNLTYVILTLALALPSLLTVMEGIYKSQSVLFEAKDSNLLFSLPISKKAIILARFLKLYVFQFLYSMLFILPGIVVYAYLEKPEIYFYVITFLMLILTPIIPTIVGCLIGYIIKNISLKFKAKRAIETIMTFAIIIVIMLISSNSSKLMTDFTENAYSINTRIISIYFPINVYHSLINSFNVISLIELLALNFIPLILFLFIVDKTYFKLVSKTKENRKNTKANSIDTLKFKPKNKIMALVKKEFSKYFSSTVYIINTLFGLLLLLIATIGICVNFDGSVNFIANDTVSVDEIFDLKQFISKIYLAIVIAMSFMTSITSSSISLEGKSFNISKSLPVSTEKLLLAKILMSNIITIPFILLCDCIFFMFIKVTALDVILILLASFLAPSIAATFGLLVNLKYPKMDASSDSEVVKQSMSSMVAVLGGIVFAILFIVLTFILAVLGDFAMIVDVVLLGLILLVLWKILAKYGKKRYKEIQI